MLEEIIERVGRFHPVFVHFPIVLILLCAFLEIRSLISKKQPFNLSGLLHAIVIFSVITAGTGLANSYSHTTIEELELYEEFHKYIGISVTALMVASLFLYKKRSSPPLNKIYLAVILLSATLVAVGSHLGATLVYGVNYLF